MSERSSRFFTWIWRVNGLLLLALLIVAAMGAGALIFNIGLFRSRDRPEHGLQQVAGADLAAQDLRLGDFRWIAGTQLLYAQLAPPSQYVGSGSSGGLGDVRNLLFFDAGTKQAHWLLPDNGRTVHSFSFLMDPPDGNCWRDDGERCKRDQKAIALLVDMERAEGASTKDRARTVAVATADGRNVTPVAQSNGGLLGYHQPDAASVLVFYVAEGAARVLDIELATRKVRSDSVLAAND